LLARRAVPPLFEEVQASVTPAAGVGTVAITIVVSGALSNEMKRRAVLATTALTLGGCSSMAGSDPAASDDDPIEDDDRDSPDPIEAGPGRFDDFEDLSRWTVMAGSMEADTDRVYAGTQSARVRAADSEERAMIKREFETPRNLSTVWPALALAADRDTDVVVQLSDVDGNRYLLRAAVGGGTPLVRRDLGVVDAIGIPDMGAIEHVKLSVWAGEGRSLTIWCGGLHLVPRPETGAVLLQFDGGFETTTAARDVLAGYGLPATAFVPIDRVGDEGRLDLEGLATLADDGWTVASQGSRGSDLTQRDRDDQRADLETARAWLADNGFDDGSEYVAYPLGRADETTLDLARETSRLAFASGYAAHGALANPHLIPRAVHPSADEAIGLVDRTAAVSGLATISYRELDHDGLAALDEAAAHLAALESDENLDVVLPGDVAKNYVYQP
jgi:hypothetical protein